MRLAGAQRATRGVVLLFGDLYGGHVLSALPFACLHIIGQSIIALLHLHASAMNPPSSACGGRQVALAEVPGRAEIRPQEIRNFHFSIYANLWEGPVPLADRPLAPIPPPPVDRKGKQIRCAPSLPPSLPPPRKMTPDMTQQGPLMAMATHLICIIPAGSFHRHWNASACSSSADAD